MKIFAVIVTYSNRFNLLKKVIQSCLEEGISGFVVVDNDSHIDSKNNLILLQEKYQDRLTIIWNSKNEGSAKGYKQGLKAAYRHEECDYIWLLDDDNCPKKEALKLLKDYWEIKPVDVLCLLSFRPDRTQYKEAVEKKQPELVRSPMNSFYGFHFKYKIIGVINFFNKIEIQNPLPLIGEVYYAPYGGMFFHKSLVDEIGYPDQNFYVYSDDHDWSYRIHKANKKIYLLLESIVEDIDTSWNVSLEKSNVFKTIREASPYRVYYTIRNRMVFEKRYLINNKFVYTINRLIFSFLLYLYCHKSLIFKTYKNAINDALRGKLGKKV